MVGDEVDNYDETEDPLSDNDRKRKGLSEGEINEVAVRLISMAETLSAEVGAHDAQLCEVNTVLHTEEAPTMETVMSAVERLIAANGTLQTQLRDSRDRIVDQSRELETAEQRANTDALTRIANRRAFDREVAMWKGETPGALALLDIDHFKKFNDTHGHRTGDEVLRGVAALLKQTIKSEGLVARYGGEEFAIVFSNCTLERGIELAEEVRIGLANQTLKFEGNAFQVTCSIGVTRMLPGEPSNQWVQRADDALYLSKDAGRDCGYCIDSQTVGVRQQPFRLSPVVPPTPIAEAKRTERDDEPISTRASVNRAVFERIPDVKSLADSYREFLQRLGKAPVKLSVVSIAVMDMETIDAGRDDSTQTVLEQLVEIVQSYCRPVDRVGYHDGRTLLVCMPGLEATAIAERIQKLIEVTTSQMQIRPTGLSVGGSTLEVGDTFESLVTRAVEQGCAASAT